MNGIWTRPWTSYLPVYRFPRILQLACGCLGLMLLGSGLFTFLIAPSLIAYIVTLDEQAELEIQVGQSLTIAGYDLRLDSVTNDTRCTGTSPCETPGTVTLIFSTTQTTDDMVIVFIEGTTFSDPISLPRGYLMRVTTVSPDGAAVEEDYTIQIQLLEPPLPAQN